VAASTLVIHAGAFPRPVGAGDFYAVVPHDILIALFGGVFLFVVVALSIGIGRFWRDVRGDARLSHAGAVRAGLLDALTLTHLHGAGGDCTVAEERRTPARRWFHHCTFYGFALCFASTSVAAVYHLAFGWRAPYAITSLPVVLGVAGGVGLVLGPVGLLMLGRRRDPMLGDPAYRGLDESFTVLLLLTSVTGLLLLALRGREIMSALLVVHLGTVLALFVMLPYGTFVHGLYRAAALIKYSLDRVPREDHPSG
jgi:citrate/tricarballylate utilization protein